ncbi:outer membrane siderophore receptor [Idiomarina sp. WRN-38]|nr:ligand-gated channel protein [Idiomarina sp. OXR-189]KTG24642.1 outer membrane siderophore receptor [Idiomarina sp. H105]MCH2455865.1 ligand-gated channel protein [Idiomarina sp.]OAE93148.1 outer membrane siderophore receptor [Idiomarina sp. WRN-38]WPZ01249.1 ligand-gated channel protein [Idiomarina sp. OXR-189]
MNVIKNGLKLGVLSMAIFSALGTAHAQDGADDDREKRRHKHKDMEVMVVTASGVAQHIKKAPASISVIDKSELSQRFYKDLTDAMTDAPGVVVTGGGDRQDISLRGMGADYTLILVDGQRQSSRETRPNSDGPGVEGAWTPPLAAIDRIEIIRGPMSSLYGSDAIGGVINIITRKTPDEWRSEIKVDGTLQERSESGNSYQTNFFTAGSLIKDTLGLQLSAGYTRRLEDEIVEGFRDKTAQDADMKLAYTPNRDHEILFEVGTAKQTIDASLGKTVEPLAPGEECGRRGCPESSSTVYDSSSVSIAHNGQWGLVGARSYLKRDEYENEARLMTITNTDFQSHWNLPLFDDNSVNTGVSYFKEELEDLTSNQVSDRTRVEGSQWSVFAETAWPLFKGLDLTTGVRYDDDDIFGGHWSPRVYGVYNLSRATTIKGGVSTGFRAPGLRETTPDWGQVSRGGDVYGNPNLEAETSTNYELGLYTDWSRHTSTSATVFYNQFDDKITRVACPATICDAGPNQFGSMPTTRVNIDEAVTRGVELTVDSRLSRHWSVKGNYTYTDSEQKSGEYAGDPLNQLPKHLIQTSLNWKPNKRWNSWLRVHYRGEESQPTTGPSQDVLVAPSYTLADLGVNYYVTRDIKLAAGIYNLLDKEIGVEEYGYVEDGRRLWLSAAYSF